MANQRTLTNLLDEAAKWPKARYTVDLTLGAEAPVPHLAGVRAIANFYSLMALVNAEAGKTEQATRAVVHSMHAAESLADEPLVSSQLVRIACQTIACDTLSDALSRTSFTDDQLRRLDDAFASAERNDTFYRCIVGERICVQGMLAKGPESYMARINEYGDTPMEISAEAKAAYSKAGHLKKELAFMDQVFAQLVLAARSPLQERFAATKEVEQTADSTDNSFFMAKPLLSAIAATPEAQIRGLAYIRSARTALAVERYRLKNGTLPQKIDELVPEFLSEMSTDPFTNRPLQYAIQGTGYIIYSLGHNQKDDAGLSPGEAKKRGLDYKESDLGIRVSRKAA